jgi:hypothetical protein
MSLVDQALEVFGGARAGGDGEGAGNVVAEGGVVGVLLCFCFVFWGFLVVGGGEKVRCCFGSRGREGVFFFPGRWGAGGAPPSPLCLLFPSAVSSSPAPPSAARRCSPAPPRAARPRPQSTRKKPPPRARSTCPRGTRTHAGRLLPQPPSRPRPPPPEAAAASGAANGTARPLQATKRRRQTSRPSVLEAPSRTAPTPRRGPPTTRPGSSARGACSESRAQWRARPCPPRPATPASTPHTRLWSPSPGRRAATSR